MRLIFHTIDKGSAMEQDWPISAEMQFLAGLEEGKSRPTGNRCSPGTDVVYKGKTNPRHRMNSTFKTYFGEQWVRAKVIVLVDSLVRPIINGEKLLEYSKPQIGCGVANRYDPKLKV